MLKIIDLKKNKEIYHSSIPMSDIYIELADSVNNKVEVGKGGKGIPYVIRDWSGFLAYGELIRYKIITNKFQSLATIKRSGKDVVVIMHNIRDIEKGVKDYVRNN